MVLSALNEAGHVGLLAPAEREGYSYFDITWRSGGVTAHDAYFTNVDAKGGKHPKYPRWGHVEWWVVKMQHCLVKWTACTNHYYKVGTIGYWDGSKKIVYSKS
jgi:hypothetical protein